MKKPQAIISLKRAIGEERIEAMRRKERYDILTAKMLAYQLGEGPAPTTAEFEQWRDDVEARVALKLLQTGV